MRHVRRPWRMVAIAVFVLVLVAAGLTHLGVSTTQAQNQTAQSVAAVRPETRHEALRELSRVFAERFESQRGQTFRDLRDSDSPADRQLREDPDIELMYIDSRGLPVYYTTENLRAAWTLSTDDVWPGGSGGFSLDGSTTVMGELGLWDAGGGDRVRGRLPRGSSSRVWP